MIAIPLWLSTSHPCSYLDHQIAQSLMVADEQRMTVSVYSELLQQGFRRSGNLVYKPYCKNCQACIPCRINVADFRPDRNQRRCLQHNQNLTAHIKPAVFDSQQTELFHRYSCARHAADPTPKRADDLSFFMSDWCKTWFVEFRLSEQLVAIAVIDVLACGLSAVYTFFDPEMAHYSLGTYAVLWQIEQAKLLDLEYVYLGYWIQNCRKMQYKNRFKPLQIFQNQQWQEFKL